MADTAEKTKRSERSVALEAERSKVADDVMQDIEGTALDTGQTLDELKKLPHEEQRERVAQKKAAPMPDLAGPVCSAAALAPPPRPAPVKAIAPPVAASIHRIGTFIARHIASAPNASGIMPTRLFDAWKNSVPMWGLTPATYRP